MPITAPASLADITDPRVANDIADPALSELPTLKAENADAIDPIDPTEPIEPIDRVDPRLAMDRKESSEARDHVEGMPPAWRHPRGPRHTSVRSPGPCSSANPCRAAFECAVDGRSADAEQVGELGGAVLALVDQGDEMCLLARVELRLLAP